MRAYILTGTPGSGKTAILRQLELNGHHVIEEAATAIIALSHALGHQEPWRDNDFIDRIVTLQRQREDAVRTWGIVFFDRSPVCTLALSRYLGYPPTPTLIREVERAEGVYQKTVFFVRNQGGVEPTAARRISFEESLVFEEVHERVYREFGFELIDVPKGPLSERVGLILRRTSPMSTTG